MICFNRITSVSSQRKGGQGGGETKSLGRILFKIRVEMTTKRTGNMGNTDEIVFSGQKKED